MKKVPLCLPAPPRSCISLNLLYWVKSERKQTFIFSVVMLIEGHTLALICSAPVSWHSLCSHLPKAPNPRQLPWGGCAPGTCCLPCACNMKAFFAGGGDFLRNIQIHFPNGFSCWFLGMGTAVQTKCCQSERALLFIYLE